MRHPEEAAKLRRKLGISAPAAGKRTKKAASRRVSAGCRKGVQATRGRASAPVSRFSGVGRQAHPRRHGALPGRPN